MFSSTLLWCIVRAGAVNCVCIPLLLAFFFLFFLSFRCFFCNFQCGTFEEEQEIKRARCVRLWTFRCPYVKPHGMCVSMFLTYLGYIYLYFINSIDFTCRLLDCVCHVRCKPVCTPAFITKTHTELFFFVSHLSNRDALEFVAAAALIVLYSHMFDATNTILFFSSLIQKRLHKTHCARAVLKSRNCLCLAISCMYVQCTEMNKFDGQTGVYESTDVSQMYNGFAIVCALSRRRFFYSDR